MRQSKSFMNMLFRIIAASGWTFALCGACQAAPKATTPVAIEGSLEHDAEARSFPRKAVKSKVLNAKAAFASSFVIPVGGVKTRTIHLFFFKTHDHRWIVAAYKEKNASTFARLGQLRLEFDDGGDLPEGLDFTLRFRLRTQNVAVSFAEFYEGGESDIRRVVVG